MKYLVLVAVLVVFAGVTSAVAGPINMEFVGPGPMDTTVQLPDGTSVYAGPYIIKINGVTYLAPCFNWNVLIPASHTWTAEEVPLSGFTLDVQTKLREQEWLNRQFPANPDQVGQIQKAIWFLSPFVGATPPTDWDNAWVSSAQANYGSVDPHSFDMFMADVSTPSQPFSHEIPEPATLFLFGIPLIAIGVARRRANTR